MFSRFTKHSCMLDEKFCWRCFLGKSFSRGLALSSLIALLTLFSYHPPILEKIGITYVSPSTLTFQQTKDIIYRILMMTAVVFVPFGLLLLFARIFYTMEDTLIRHRKERKQRKEEEKIVKAEKKEKEKMEEEKAKQRQKEEKEQEDKIFNSLDEDWKIIYRALRFKFN